MSAAKPPTLQHPPTHTHPLAHPPSGLSIMGAYAYCPDTAFASSSPLLTALLRDIRAELPKPHHGTLLIALMDSVTGRLSFKEQEGAGLKPCDSTHISLLPNFMMAECK